MAVAAVVLYLVFAALGFGWRSWRQWRTTGSAGFRGISRGSGSLEWIAGTGFVAAIVTGVTAPLLQLAGVLAPLDVLNASWIQTAGVVLAVTGSGATVYAQNDMGESWRIGVDPSETTTLVHQGVFAVVRNPIFTAMLIFALGIVFMTPNPLAVAGFALLVAAIEVQVRVVEEPYLRAVHGQHYREYTATVGRFLPRVGLS
ncbi:isoprenylcysteine carboxyl methyltransferase [Mycobacterium nebraskense]|jgi:protein-S-isoprenylcysteine O-methyltransferase Ste14|uniref:Isoprenylcysteine carboxyl methyltransferase n=1 Tax=Mycobacterium nebraskense TaxID=244292 RepID=A0A1X1YYK8_9MYCO|nr:isoprenylcysteine carboxylmethyltransferase family protein [Mycobacterium nebraskense]MCV7117761.1 isoprenylcysteine carboxylmethyltransferase family protein [Mycobacterium nebraskense]ORW16166.1 isoprenylcysteine carboxyl methyltransferase [Mycobacterium nebraskense]